MTKLERDCIISYRDNVLEYNAIARCIEWRNRYNLPLISLPDKKQQLMENIMRFEYLMDEIQNRRTRVILRCRYALGMSDAYIAYVMKVNRQTVYREIDNALKIK